jgi:hypothetical protein
MIDFMNLKIKSTQSFRCVYTCMIYVCMFIEVKTDTYMNIYIFIMFKKKNAASIKTWTNQ